MTEELERRVLAPAPGARIRKPTDRSLLAEAGESIEMDSFWRRRLIQGDVVDLGAPPAATFRGDEA